MKKESNTINVSLTQKTVKHLLRGVVTAVLCAGLALGLTACDKAEEKPKENNVGTVEKCPPHSFGLWAVTVAPTCAEEGKMVRTCSDCGAREEKLSPKTEDHRYGEWKTLMPADCSQSGVNSRVCTVCNKTETETVPQTDEHIPFTVPAFEGNCMEKGTSESVYCEVCYLELVAPVETEYGYHSYFEGECIFCGEAVKESAGLAFTYNEETEGYFVSGIGSCTDKEIFIPAMHEGKPVTGIAEKAFEKSDITYVYVPEGVLEIRLEAFLKCTALKRVEGCYGVVRIEEQAFHGCASLLYFEAYGMLDYIGEAAFFGCAALVEIYLPEVMTAIEDYAFADCSSLETAVLPLCEKYGDYIFQRCKSLTEIVIPAGITAIPEKIFDLCESLTDIHFLGTEDEWNELIKGRESEFENITVVCWGDEESEEEEE